MLGIGPRFTLPKSAVLPLYDIPVLCKYSPPLGMAHWVRGKYTCTIEKHPRYQTELHPVGLQSITPRTPCTISQAEETLFATLTASAGEYIRITASI
jgi:hypothetical protein